LALFELKNIMALFESVTNTFQDDHIILYDVRILFDAIIADFPIMSKYLDSSAQIIHSNIFENAIVKVLKGSELDLIIPEKIAIEKFIKYSDQVQCVHKKRNFFLSKIIK
jgi:hypothetical protein